MTKAEVSNPYRDRILVEKRIAATHTLLDLVEKGEVPTVQPNGTMGEPVKPTVWGTLKDNWPEEYDKRIIIP